jgi:predicted CopG family antitoxin
METTIQVHEDVLEQLKTMKRETGAKTNEEVIKMLIKAVKSLKKSHFATLPNLKTFEREEID